MKISFSSKKCYEYSFSAAHENWYMLFYTKSQMDSWGIMHRVSYYINNMQIYSVYDSLKFMAQQGSKVVQVRAYKSDQEQVARLHWEICFHQISRFFQVIFASWGCTHTCRTVFLWILQRCNSLNGSNSLNVMHVEFKMFWRQFFTEAVSHFKWKAQ